MQSYIIIAPVGDAMESLFPLIRTFPTEKVILIASDATWKDAHEFKETLSVFKLPILINKVETYSIDSIFKSVREILDKEKNNEILLNVGSADKLTSCFALCAAYVYGVSAVAVMNEQVMMLPIMKFSYYKAISDPKLKILKVAYESSNYITLEKLRQKTKMSAPLISYHLNGTTEVEGLKQMDLIETREKRKKVEIKLSKLGEILMAGYL